MKRQTIYSIRDALGGELWWTTGRADAVRVTESFNTIGVGAVKAVVAGKARVGKAQDASYGLRDHHLPVALFRCAPVKVTP